MTTLSGCVHCDGDANRCICTPIHRPSQRGLPPFEGNPMKTPPPGAHVRVWTQEGTGPYDGHFDKDPRLARFTSDDGRLGMAGVGYCRIENADTGEVYYDNGWWR